MTGNLATLGQIRGVAEQLVEPRAHRATTQQVHADVAMRRKQPVMRTESRNRPDGYRFDAAGGDIEVDHALFVQLGRTLVEGPGREHGGVQPSDLGVAEPDRVDVDRGDVAGQHTQQVIHSRPPSASRSPPE